MYDAECSVPMICEDDDRVEMDDKMKLARYYVRIDDTTYSFVEDVVKELKSAFYRPIWDSYKGQAKLEKREVVTPNLYRLPDSNLDLIMNDIKTFWESEDKYKKFGNVYKRSILLYSVPGNGKTSLINILAFDLIKEYNGLVITINSIDDLYAYPKCVERIRNIEPKRKILTILEDFDGIIKNEAQETMLLQLLDGNNQFDNIVTIATTNHIKNINQAFLNRPSRFNLLIKYDTPSKEVREYYFTHKWQDSGVDVNDENVKKLLNEMTEKSEGYTFDYCKELAELVFISNLTAEEAATKINKRISMDGKLSEGDNTKKVGF